MKTILIFFVALLFLNACVKAPPANMDNVCKIFKQYPSWYKDAKAAESTWGVPVAVQMAIIHQESRFNGKALPPRQKLLWIIPWKRPSTAYGYSQALKSTWANYKKKRGGMFVSRNDFGDAVDFIGWYAHQTRKRTGISPSNAAQLYLAYHEGAGGFIRKTYLKKKWLVAVAKKVNLRAHKYQTQLKGCEKRLHQKSWLGIF